jgi:hypothetical protein
MVGWSVPGVVHLRQMREDPVGRRVLTRHRVTRKPLAITYLSPEFLADTEFRTRFRGEFARLAQVRDARVARAHRYVEDDHGAAVINEHVSGISLRALLLAQGAVGTAAALVVLKDALLALIACHKAGLAHGDIKPEDVILTHAGRVRLVDVGLWTSEGRRQLARSTPFYLAPEQWSDPPVGQAGDIYAATVTFFECLLGAPPFYADDVAELSAKHQRGVAPVEVVPELVRELVEQGLTKDPRSRPEARCLLTLASNVAARAVGPDWERRGRRELAALLASRSALPEVPSRYGRAGSGYGKPVRLAAVMGGALALAAGLSSPPLAVLPGISIFGSGARPPVLAFPEPDRGTVAVRAATNGPLADRAPGRAAGRPLVSSLPAPNIQVVPYEHAGPEVRHPGAGYPDGTSPGRPAPGQVASAAPACAQALVGDHKPCTAVKPGTPGSAGATTDPSPVSIPVSLPVQLPVQMPATVEILVALPVQVPVQLSAPARPPVQVPQSIPRPDHAVPGRDTHFSKDFQAQPHWQESRKKTRAERSGTTRNSGRQLESHPHSGFGNSSGTRHSGNR